MPPLAAPAARLPVCVIIPAYNRAATLPRCLASIWSQRPSLPAEVIVVDDGSTDATAEVARAHGARVISHPRNRGFAALARNTGLHATSCEWAAFLDSDDEWLPGHLEHLWRLRGDHALVGSSSLRCGAPPNRDRFHGPITREPLVLRSPDRLISSYNLFTTSGCMVRRNVALELGGFQQKWVAEDLDLWVRLLERHSAVCSSRVTVIYHMHNDSLSADGGRMLNGHREVAEASLSRAAGSSAVGLRRKAVKRWEGVMAWDRMRLSLDLGQPRAALRCGLAMVSEPQRIAGVFMLLRERFRARRAASRIGRDGRPTVTLLMRDDDLRRAVRDRLRGRTLRDLSSCPTASALLTLARRPAGMVVVGCRAHAAALRAVGIRAVGAPALLAQSH